MITILEYNFTSVTKEDDVLIVGFADAQFNTQHYLMFQRSLDEFESDEEIYIERDGQHQGIYGGIEKLILFRNKALVNLNLETSERLSVEQEVIVKFSVLNKKFIELASGFEELFFDKEILEIK